MKCRVEIYSHSGWRDSRTYETTAAAMTAAKKAIRRGVDPGGQKYKGGVRVVQLAFRCGGGKTRAAGASSFRVGYCRKIKGRIICKIFHPQRKSRT